MWQRTIVGIIATALIAAASVFGVRALHSMHSAVMPPVVSVEDRQQKPDEMRKIAPATAEGPGSGFFIGTGDGGNGHYTK
jgi:hypothetical protein